MKVTYTEEASANIVEAITLSERTHRTVAAKLDWRFRAAWNVWQLANSKGRFLVLAPPAQQCIAEACRHFASTTTAT